MNSARLTIILLSFSIFSIMGFVESKKACQNQYSLNYNISTSFNNYSLSNSDNQDVVSILELFEIYTNTQIDTVFINILDKNHFKLSYYDKTSIYENKIQTKVFEGKMLRNGSFQIYLRKKNIEIPPLLPIFYSNRDIYRLKISFDTNDNLIIEQKWARDGNVFLMAAGTSGKETYTFNKL